MRAGRRANASTDHPEHASAAVGEVGVVGEDEVVRGRVATTCCCIMERSELAFFGQEEDDYGGSSEDRIKSLLADGDRGIPRRRIARRPGHSAPIMFSEVRATLSPRPLPAVRPGPVVLFGLPVARPRGLILSRGLGAALRPADAAGEQPQGHRHDARLEQQQGAARRRDGPAALLADGPARRARPAVQVRSSPAMPQLWCAPRATAAQSLRRVCLPCACSQRRAAEPNAAVARQLRAGAHALCARAARLRARPGPARPAAAGACAAVSPGGARAAARARNGPTRARQRHRGSTRGTHGSFTHAFSRCLF